MIELPKEVVKASRTNAKKIVIFSQPKVGKSSFVSSIPNNLILDLEGGTSFIDALKIDILEKSRKLKLSPLQTLKEVINTIREANEQKGDFVYKYITVDTVTALEDISIELANILYKKTAIGKNWQGDDVRQLPNGGGYLYSREAMSIILNEIESLCETLIILGHTKDKFIEVEGKELPVRGLDLAGKLASILCAQVDAVGYMYRDGNETKINFKPSESITIGSRPKHLENQIITVITKKEDGDLEIDWTKIFKE